MSESYRGETVLSRYPQNGQAKQYPAKETISITPQQLALCSSKEARQCLSYESAQNLGALPLGLTQQCHGEVLSVAVAQNSHRDIKSLLQFETGRMVRVQELDASLVQDALFRAYKGDDSEISVCSRKLRENVPEKSRALSPMGASFRGSESEVPKFVEATVDYALAQGASDIHLVPTRDGCVMRMRRRGTLLTRDEVVSSTEGMRRIVQRIKVLSGMDTAQHAMPQDGSFEVSLPIGVAHVRASIMPTINGEKVVLRLMGKENAFKLEELGLDGRTAEALQGVFAKAEGMILYAGATGSGKTTSMYAVVKELAGRNLSVVTVEDPAEMVLSGVSQTSIDEKHGVGYGECLRAILRQDPDVIMIGEIRDAQSAAVAFQAAVTGHLVVATVHARNVFEVLLRLKHLGIDALSCAQALDLLVCQQLVPSLCENCRVTDLLTSNTLGFEAFKAVGCAACDYTGFAGQVLLAESLSIDEPVRQVLRDGQFGDNAFRAVLSPQNYSSPQKALETALRQGKVVVP